jgi:hypothetical protein
MDKGKNPEQVPNKGGSTGANESANQEGSVSGNIGQVNPDPIMVSTLAHFIKEDTQQLNKALLT